jgi:hypothetical protein
VAVVVEQLTILFYQQQADLVAVDLRMLGNQLLQALQVTKEVTLL